MSLPHANKAAVPFLTEGLTLQPPTFGAQDTAIEFQLCSIPNLLNTSVNHATSRKALLPPGVFCNSTFNLTQRLYITLESPTVKCLPYFASKTTARSFPKKSPCGASVPHKGIIRRGAAFSCSQRLHSLAHESDTSLNANDYSASGPAHFPDSASFSQTSSRESSSFRQASGHGNGNGTGNESGHGRGFEDQSNRRRSTSDRESAFDGASTHGHTQAQLKEYFSTESDGSVSSEKSWRIPGLGPQLQKPFEGRFHDSATLQHVTSSADKSISNSPSVSGLDPPYQLLTACLLVAGFFAAPLLGQKETVTHDLLVTGAVLVAGTLWVKMFEELKRRNLLEQKLSRKLVHISTGVAFMLSWPCFSAAPTARLFAAVVPLANALKLLLQGLGLTKNEASVASMTRGGSPKELLAGPLYYVLGLFSVVLLFWRDSPTGVIALSLMCGGDGFADIVGRRFGDSAKLPWNPQKSWAGSIAMLLSGFTFALIFTFSYSCLGFYVCDVWSTVVRIAIISLAATFVESAPFSDRVDDNVSVPLTACVLGALLFPTAGPPLMSLF
eukprot:TRINITY_DN375_c0_g1_i1.p1 TRINITY_DN375_c0_g1~~TRINITY_DN375_c0_g1_i1.p1  ORF type:complete len:555 (-),score=52.25 TRINITY_DN375_c0_g1_i1:171-1835(-)